MSQRVGMKTLEVIRCSTSFIVSADVVGKEYSMSAGMWVEYRDTAKNFSY